MQIQSILFDLDGTLADTAPDLGYALNQVLQRTGREPLSLDAVRLAASNGSAALIRLGFGEKLDQATFNRYQQELLGIYQDNLTRETRLMEGMEPLLEQLENRSIPWGVVTNKPSRFTDPLMQQLNLSQRAACIVSGDTTPHSKPHPAPLLHACKLTGVAPEQTIYIGDHGRDIVAGKNAGMATIACRFGYLSAEEDIDSWGADSVIDHPQEITQWI